MALFCRHSRANAAARRGSAPRPVPRGAGRIGAAPGGERARTGITEQEQQAAPVHILAEAAASHPWIKRHFTGLTATIEQMRVDRQLEEALSAGPDRLHLAAVFGISDQTAIRYAHAARQLLTE